MCIVSHEIGVEICDTNNSVNGGVARQLLFGKKGMIDGKKAAYKQQVNTYHCGPFCSDPLGTTTFFLWGHNLTESLL